MSNFPQRTSYFSVNTFLTSHMMQETAIALDILKQYYDKQDLLGYNIRVLSIEGYGEFVSFNELCLGLWMVFDRLYWGFPPDVQESVGISAIGWNGDIDDPYVDIPMALEMFDQLSASVFDTDEKKMRLEAIEKWFYKSEPNFLNYTTYEVLKTLNETFYNWIESKLQAIEEALNSLSLIQRVSKQYLFDIKPFAKFFDSKYSLSDAEMGVLNRVLIEGNRLYLSFLATLEQMLYSFTKKLFPLRIYAIFSYLYKTYMQIVINFVKPYHAFDLKLAPILRIDGDIDESITASDYLARTIIKYIPTGVIHRLFDGEDTKDDSLYDVTIKIRDYVLVRYLAVRSITNTFIIPPNLDSEDDFVIMTTLDYLLDNPYGEIIEEETLIYKEELYSKTYTGHFASNWKFYIPTMNNVDNLRRYLDQLTWDPTTGTVLNTWDKDVILVARSKYRIANGCSDINISATCDPEVRFAFNFDSEQNIIHFENRHNDLLSNCWCYKDNWYKKSLPYIYDIFSIAYLDPYPRELIPSDVLDMSEFMTSSDIANIHSFPYNVGWIVPIVYIPKGKSFTSISFSAKTKNMVYPYVTNIPYALDVVTSIPQ